MIYCRVSTKEQADEGNSLASQKKINSEYALKNGYEIARVFTGQGESAKTADRPELKELITYCTNKKNGISAVIVYKVDRLARNLDDYRRIKLLLKSQGIDVKSTTEFFEDTPAGRFMENIIANVAQFDNDVRTERSVGGMRDAIRDGRFVWGAPLGYDNVKIASKSNIVPNNMALLVRKAFEKVAENNLPVDEVRRQLTKEGLVNRKGKPISKAYFYLMLSNEIYAGWIVGLGERVKGIYEPLISQELFDHVQLVLKRRTHRVLQYKRDNPDFPLRRFVAHPSGKKLTGCWAKGRTKKYPYYLFHMPGLEFKKKPFEIAFMNFFDEYRLNDRQLAKLKKGLVKHVIEGCEKQRTDIALAQKRTSDLKEKRNLLIQKNLDGVLSDAILGEQLELIEAELVKAGSLIVSPFNFEKRDIGKDFDIVAEYSKKPSKIWDIAPLSSKTKLQWFNFPKGVTFDGKKFRTIETCNLFKGKDGSELQLSNGVHPMISSSNQSTIPNETYWGNITKEICDLAAIIEEINR